MKGNRQRTLANRERAYACYRAGQLAEAKTLYARICRRDRNDADAWFMLAMINGRLEAYAEAERCGIQAARRRADHAETWFNLGRAQELQEKFEEAIASYRRAVALRPDWVDAHNNLGNALAELHRYDEALVCYGEALRLNPDYLRTAYNIAKLTERRGDWRAALAGFDDVIARDPGFVAARWDRALMLLTGGRLAEGWRDYEYGFAVGERRVRSMAVPRWQGEPLAGKTIFVCAEQGVGDQILFISCLPDLIARAGHCVVECEPRLLPLFARSFPQASFLPAATPLEALPRPVDVYVPMGSLPGLFRPDLASYPAHRGLLRADPSRVVFWRERYRALGDGLKVGISWRGGARRYFRAKRSTGLEQWRAVLATPGVAFVNLQYGDSRAEIAAVSPPGTTAVHRWDAADPLHDLDDFAAQVAALDRVISVNNTTVHVAGALGVPVWTLLSLNSEWRWLRDRDDSPWYPAMRLFRQPTLGEWPPVFEAVAGELKQLVRRR